MTLLNRRNFLATNAFTASTLFGASSRSSKIDATLRSGMERRKIPAVVAMAASDRKTLYSGAFGTRDSSRVPVHGCPEPQTPVL